MILLRRLPPSDVSLPSIAIRPPCSRRIRSNNIVCTSRDCCSWYKQRLKMTVFAPLRCFAERNWHMPRIPGFSSEEINAFRSKQPTETHKQRLHVLRRSFAAAAAAEAVAHAQQASAGAAAQASKSTGSKSGGTGSSKPPASKVRVVE